MRIACGSLTLPRVDMAYRSRFLFEGEERLELREEWFCRSPDRLRGWRCWPSIRCGVQRARLVQAIEIKFATEAGMQIGKIYVTTLTAAVTALSDGWLRCFRCPPHGA